MTADQSFRKISPRLFSLPASKAAPRLLGKLFLRKAQTGYAGGIITETEAYEEHEPASHSYRGITERSKVMFGPGGFLYVYFIYGMHYCANVVTGKRGTGEAVLIRGIYPLFGIEYIRSERNRKNVRTEKLLAGPGNICKGLGISQDENGIDLQADEIMIAEPVKKIRFKIETSRRIGITKAAELPWRFTLQTEGAFR
ncbi:MAG: DNA-3-methyladenine glycosylase [Ignavibacteriaceae bacterium]|nr:DNA-3-methyladenine glycosylase [Ignavibacteriaceae bacterium]